MSAWTSSLRAGRSSFLKNVTGLKIEGFRLPSKKYAGVPAGSSLDFVQQLGAGCHHRFVLPGRVAQSVGHLTRKSGVLGSIPGVATYFRFSFRFFKKGSCQLLAKVCARNTG